MNDGDQAVSLIYLFGCLVLVASALMVRRLPISQGLKMAGAWVLIFAAVFAAFALRDDFRALGDRLLAGATAEPTVQGSAVRIQQDSDGHYWVNARVNGQTIRFLIDSGATVTAISRDTAEQAGIDAHGGFPVAVNTANGTTFMRRASAARLTVGTIERRDFPVWIGEENGDLNVLGMNFLSSLSSWGTESGWLVLRP